MHPSFSRLERGMENSHGVLAVPLSTAANMLIESKALYDCREVDGCVGVAVPVRRRCCAVDRRVFFFWLFGVRVGNLLLTRHPRCVVSVQLVVDFCKIQLPRHMSKSFRIFALIVFRSS